MKNLKHFTIIVSLTIAFIVSVDDSLSHYSAHTNLCEPIQTSDLTILHHQHGCGTDLYFQKRPAFIIRQKKISEIQVLRIERIEKNQFCSFFWQPPKDKF